VFIPEKIMVAGYHLIWTVYGFWLPNDPRGSTSKEVRVVPIADLGEHHYGRKEKQPSSKDVREFLDDVKEVLAHSVLLLDDDDIALVGTTFGAQIVEHEYVCYACAIMPDHVHILIRRDRDRAESMIGVFQEASRTALIDAGKRLPTHPVWTKGPGWKTFINTQRQFQNEIRYIGNNPRKIGKPEQKWDFVQEYDGWLP
jgi:REP element-mobilizing transposase RayT